MENFARTLESVLGGHLRALDLTTWQVVLRAVVVYGFALFLLRVSARRSMSQATPFDVVLMFVLGSVLSRAINSDAPFFGTLAAAAALVAVHRGLAALAFRFSGFSRVIKGESKPLVRDGQILEEALSRYHIHEQDLQEQFRLEGKVFDASCVKDAYLERSGRVSVICAEVQREPRVIELKVEEGVKTVRIELAP